MIGKVKNSKQAQDALDELIDLLGKEAPAQASSD